MVTIPQTRKIVPIVPARALIADRACIDCIYSALTKESLDKRRLECLLDRGTNEHKFVSKYDECSAFTKMKE